MTLKEKFVKIYEKYCAVENIVNESEKAADEFAIGFVEWLGKYGNTRLNNGNWMINHELKALTSKEVLEIYKNERNL
jgi:hypothetical protein